MAPSVKCKIKSHSYTNNSFLNELNISKKETADLIIPILSYTEITTSLHTMTLTVDATKYRKELETRVKESFDNTITFYTDGSRTESGVRTGFLTTANNSPYIYVL